MVGVEWFGEKDEEKLERETRSRLNMKRESENINYYAFPPSFSIYRAILGLSAGPYSRRE